jgi:hypothetical protein
VLELWETLETVSFLEKSSQKTVDTFTGFANKSLPKIKVGILQLFLLGFLYPPELEGSKIII